MNIIRITSKFCHNDTTAEKNYVSILNKIVNLSGSFLKDPLPCYCNAVCASMANGNLEIFSYLIESGFKISCCRIHISILCGKYNILEYIFDKIHEFNFVLDD